MPLGLREGLSFCLADGRAIFLDVANDRYFCLPSRLNELFLGLLNPDSAMPSDEPQLTPLVTPHATAPLSPTQAISPVFALLPASRKGVRWSLFFQAVLSQCHIRGQSRLALGDKLSRIEDRRRRVTRRPTDLSVSRLKDIVTAFGRSRIVFETQDQCLARSLALNHLLARNGYDSQLIIGVRPRPFAAHCWVQRGDIVVNDHLETVRAYTPILVI